MTLLHLILVALIQGITEFLPVSSSGHLILLPNLTGLEDQGQAIDVAVHVGTLFAVMLYFRSDTTRIARGVPKLMTGRLDDPDSWLVLCLVIATIPVVIVGFILNRTGLDDAMRSTAVIGWTMIVFGLVLYWADRTGSSERSGNGWTLRHAFIMGLWQVLALIPGTSRSGITITGARRLGYGREEAARLAMLMSIPTILTSGVLLTGEVIATADAAAARDGAIAAAFAFLAALAALWGMMTLLKRVSFTPYVIYRVILGTILLAIAYI